MRKKRNLKKKVQKKVEETTTMRSESKEILDMEHVKSLMKQKRYSEVLVMLQDESYAIEKDLKYELTLGEALMEVGKLDEAMENLERTVEKYPNIFWAFVIKGRLLFKMGKNDEAKALFEEVIVKFPGEADILEKYNIYRPGEQEESFEQSVASGKEILDMEHVKSLMKQKRHAEILNMLQDESYAIEKDLKYELTLGEALMEVGKLDEAMENLERTVEKYSNNFWAYVIKGRLLFKMGKDDEAKALFEEVIEKFPEDADALEKYNIYKRSTEDEGYSGNLKKK